MNNDGFGFMGAGQNDLRQEGNDLQHSTQAAGPIKEHLSQEEARHTQAAGHRTAHLLKHLERNYNSQHGHDIYKY